MSPEILHAFADELQKLAQLYPEELGKGEGMKPPKGVPRPGGVAKVRLGAGKPAGNSPANPFSGNTMKVGTTLSHNAALAAGAGAILGGGLLARHVVQEAQQLPPGYEPPRSQLLHMARSGSAGSATPPAGFPYGAGSGGYY